jgi:CheY-like chemotaxis protein
MGKKILVVDDDPDLVDATSMILQSKKYDVVTAYDGVEGMEQAIKEKPDLIVLDVMMPQKDGYTLCKELKADPDLRRIPVTFPRPASPSRWVWKRKPTISSTSRWNLRCWWTE